MVSVELVSQVKDTNQLTKHCAKKRGNLFFGGTSFSAGSRGYSVLTHIRARAAEMPFRIQTSREGRCHARHVAVLGIAGTLLYCCFL
jgi:hypothetical protein